MLEGELGETNCGRPALLPRAMKGGAVSSLNLPDLQRLARISRAADAAIARHPSLDVGGDGRVWYIAAARSCSGRFGACGGHAVMRATFATAQQQRLLRALAQRGCNQRQGQQQQQRDGEQFAHPDYTLPYTLAGVPRKCWTGILAQSMPAFSRASLPEFLNASQSELL